MEEREFEMSYDWNYNNQPSIKDIWKSGQKSPFVPEENPNNAKFNYSFHWKLKGDTALILTDLDNQMTIFDFSHL